MQYEVLTETLRTTQLIAERCVYFYKREKEANYEGDYRLNVALLVGGGSL